MFTGIIGAAMVIAGFIFLSLPISAPMSDGGSWSCRSGLGFGGAGDAARSEYQMRRTGDNLTRGPLAPERFPPLPNCDAARESRMLWAWPLVGVGALVILGAMFVDVGKPRPAGGR